MENLPRFCSFVLLLSAALVQCQTKPNVVIIMADDFGSNDASFRGSNQVLTPNIDALGYNGVIFDRYYTPQMCTPSRSSFMTGKYPAALGLQSWVIPATEGYGLGLNEKLLPNYFKDAGYKTHLIGKWHLGYYQRKYTPTYRGFDSFFGYYNGNIDYYNFTCIEPGSPYMPGYDLRKDTDVNYNVPVGTYATDLFTDETIKLIKSHDGAKNPLFLMLTHLAPHAGNNYELLQAPKEDIEKFNYIVNPQRKILAAMISKLDDSVGKIVEALKDKGILDNTIIVFTSDNGAPTAGFLENFSSNHPLKGQKNSPWEGAIRNHGMVYSPLIKASQRVYNGYIHTADMLPTLASAAGIEIDNVEGYDQWNVLVNGGASPRNEIVSVLDNIVGFSGIISGRWKFVNGTNENGMYDSDVGEIQEFPLSTASYASFVLNSRVGRALSEHNTKIGKANLTPLKITNLRKKLAILCNAADNPKIECKPLIAPCLFDILADPCELKNIASIYPATVEKLRQRMVDLARTAAPTKRKFVNDPRSDPALHMGTWSWWVADNAE